MTLASLVVPTYRQMLGALSGWLDKARSQLSADEAEAMLSVRLAPDMFPLSTQIRFACVQAYEGVFRLGNEAFAPIVATLLNEGRNAGEQPGGARCGGRTGAGARPAQWNDLRPDRRTIRPGLDLAAVLFPRDDRLRDPAQRRR